MNYNFKTPEELNKIKAEVEGRIRKIKLIQNRTNLLLEEIKTKEKREIKNNEAKATLNKSKKAKNTPYVKNNIPPGSSKLISRDKRQLEKLQQYENEELAREHNELQLIDARLNSLQTAQQQQGAQRIKVTIVFSVLLLIILSLFAIVSLNPDLSAISGASAHSNLTEIGSQDLQTLPEVQTENSAQPENLNQQEGSEKEPDSILTSLSAFLRRFFSGSTGTSSSLTGAAIGTLPIEETALEEKICTQVTVCKNESIVSCTNVSTSPQTPPSPPSLTLPSLPECIPTCINETTETCQEECLPVCQEEKINGAVREVCISECSVICKPETVETCSESCLQVLDEATNQNETIINDETINNNESNAENDVCTTEIVENCNTEEICETTPIKEPAIINESSIVNDEINAETPVIIPPVEETPEQIIVNETAEINQSEPAAEKILPVNLSVSLPLNLSINKTIVTENITKEKNGSVKDKSRDMFIEGFLGITTVTSAGNAYYNVTNTSGSYNVAGTTTSCNTAAGTLLNGNGDDGVYQASLGFAFPYFNQVKSATNSSGDPMPIYMDTNGRLSWNDPASDFNPSDTEMQSEQNIAALWQDLGDDAANNEYICTNQGSAPNRYAVFRWDSTYYNNDGKVQTEAVLFENGTIYLQHGKVASHTDADPTIWSGISLGDDANYRFNSSLTINDTVLANNSLYIFARNNPPTLNTLTLNSTNLLRNDTFRNLTANASVSDTNGDSVKVIYNWLRNGTSITVLNMPFEGVNNTAINNAWDYSGYSNNGSEQRGAFWNYTGGFDGKGAYEFNGTTSYINIIDSKHLNLSKVFTFAMWIKPKGPLKTSQYVCGKAYNGDAFILTPSIYLSTNDVSIGWTGHTGDGSGGTTGARATASSAITADVWSHVAATYDGATVNLYVNGKLKASNAETSIPNLTSQDFVIGRRGDIADDAAQVFNGTIDEFFIFNRSLSADQIWNLYQNQTYKLDDNETIRSDIWSVQGTPNDGWYDGAMLTSNSLTILNAVPTQGTPILNTTNLATNDTDVN
ncbi:MAG: LamG-like jellyroll fold domain-containing protein, partial [Nanoarchaeota archaeon]